MLIDADWMDDRVEAYLDGALPPDEHIAFERQLRADAAWQAELRLARQVRRSLRGLPQPSCPPQVTQAVLAEAQHRRRAAQAARWDTWLERFRQQFWQPALAMGVLVLLVMTATLLGRPPAPQHDPEVAQALADVQWTLAYLSEVGRQTGEAVREEVLEEHVVTPVQRAIGPLFQETSDAQPTEIP